MELDFDKMNGLVPAIIQDNETCKVLMLGFPLFCLFLEKKNPRTSLKFRDLHRLSFLKSGATKNRTFKVLCF